ncbi:solute carrier family 35 member F2-like isoform X1 [Mytilus edulis]|uniref:solute carrier family 35 member F2-like isoform X1 n=2 Tax=Mytilus edulis TaxID=6550 RepID=UPI0039EE504F
MFIFRMSSDVQETDTEPLLPHHELTIGASEISINDPDSKKQNLCSQVYTFVCIKIKSILSTKYFWKCVLLGQFISLLLCGTAVTSGLLSRKGVHTPTAQSFLNYVLLCLIFTVSLACRRGDRSLVYILKTSGWKYFIISLADVEANYLVVKAYSYTTVTSVQLLDCFSIVTVLLLSYFVLRVRYHFVNGVGVVTCFLGLIALVLTDSLTGNNKDNDGASNKVLGDIFCAGGAFLYGVSNVAEEFVVKNFDRTEFLAMLGLFGSLINGVQFAVFERHEVESVDFYSAEIVICFVGFTICQFALYTCMTIVIQQTSATTVNISLLTADFYTLLLGLFLFKYQFHGLYFGSFAVILLGVAIYATKEPERKINEPEMTNKEPVTQ